MSAILSYSAASQTQYQLRGSRIEKTRTNEVFVAIVSGCDLDIPEHKLAKNQGNHNPF
jgi:hypothetical protein